jgi:hemerythrin
MHALKWSISHAVFVTEIDDEHKELFQAVSALEHFLSSGGSSLEIRKAYRCLSTCIVQHFAHEERLMRAARYGSLGWHKRQHNNARRRVGQFILGIEQGDPKAGSDLAAYLKSWLPDHTRLADRMMGAFLRNHQRCVWKVTFQAATKPINAGAWVKANGDRFEPVTGLNGF